MSDHILELQRKIGDGFVVHKTFGWEREPIVP